MATQAAHPYAQQLRTTKDSFLSQVANGAELSDWIVSVGNEAGDLDSLASALAYAHFAAGAGVATASNRRHVPLFLPSRNDLRLRPENLLALETAQVPVEALLTIDDLPKDRLANLGTQFALVDHNVLLDMFRSRSEDPADSEDDARVVAILDHHVDERRHLAADPRTIELIGSCASLVTEHFYPSASKEGSAPAGRIPTPLADLLLSAIVIDTRLKPSADGGKAAEVDLAAVRTLLPFSSFATSSTVNASSTSETSSSSSALDSLRAFNTRLSDAKEDVSHLSGHDLLRRDYKEYHEASVRYGLSTVPLSLSTWLSKFDQPEERAVETLVQEVRDWMDERDLSLAGVLTSYTHIKKSGAAGSRRREILIVARGAEADDSLAKVEQIFAGLEKDKVLELEGWKAKKTYGIDEGSRAGQQGGREGWERWKVWQQGNARATRKQVAPALKNLVHDVFGTE